MTPTAPRGKAAPSYTIRVETPCGPCYVTVAFQDGRPNELFLRMKNNGCCQFATAEVIGKFASRSMRNGTDPHDIYKDLKGVNCGRTAWNEGEMVMSCFDAMAQAFKEAWTLYDENSGQLSLLDTLVDEAPHDLPFQEPQAA